ncbi:hypothetical protein TWF694_007863 [Orbilia ellipsospora]|uniref:Uncharacterized protein n=1 Tax=Orbilia ellipsospora TaxID=2528407 RepID=A0AAV9XIZ1_9PEZI
MRWLASAAALQLLCLVDLATAIPDYDQQLQSKRLTGRQEALLLFKRQSSTCPNGYFQCPIEFGGGCCANGRICATSSCPAGISPMQPMPNPSASNAPAPPATSAQQPTQQPTQAPPTTQQPTTAPPETTAQPTTQAPPPSSTDAPASTQPPAPSSSAASSGTNTLPPSGTATDAAEAAASTSADPAAAGTLYAPRGISSGAIVGIVFAGITGAVIVGLVLWRAIIGIKSPKKGKRPMMARAGGSGGGGGGGGVFGALKNPFAKKQPPVAAAQSMMQHHHDQAPMSHTAAAMGFGPHNGGGEGVPPYMQDRSSLDEHDTSYNSNRGLQGGDLGYRSVESFDRDDANQGLFHR